MTRSWAIFAVAAAILVLIDGGKYAGMVVLTALMPVYALLLASVFFIVFLLTAFITVPIGQSVLDRVEKIEVRPEEAQHREAA